MSVEVSPDDLTHTQLERADIVRVSRAVEATVERFGFQLDPRAGEILRDSEMSGEYQHRILASYVLQAGRGEHGRVEIYVGLRKDTKSIRVFVRDFDSVRSTEFTRSLDEAIVAALTAAVPQLEVRSTRGMGL